MNISSVLGLLIAVLVFVGGILTSTNNWKIYLNFHAFLIVIGGTMAATLVSFPFKQIVRISKIVVKKVLGRKDPAHITVIEELISLSRGIQQNGSHLSDAVDRIENPFLKEAVMLQLEGGLPDSKIDSVLKKRAEVHYFRYEEEAHVFKTMARFPPAFGLLGAVSGMIALMGGLGSPDSFKLIGPAMAVAMVATMYGIAIANFIFVPMGEYLSKLNKEDHLMRNIVLDGLKLLRTQEHPVIVEEHLKSYLLSSERLTLKNQDAA